MIPEPHIAQSPFAMKGLATDALVAITALAQAKGRTRNMTSPLCGLPEAEPVRMAIKAAVDGGCPQDHIRELMKAAFGGDLAGQSNTTVGQAALFPAMEPEMAQAGAPGIPDTEEGMERSMAKAMATCGAARPIEKAQVGAYTRTHMGKVIQVQEYTNRRQSSMGATKQAHAVTHEAMKSNKSEDHQKAMAGHLDALRHHTEAHELSPADVSQDHKELMEHHRAAARWHSDKAKGATGAYGTEKVEARGPERVAVKAHHEASTRVVNGKVVQVQPYDEGRTSALHTPDEQNPKYALQTHSTKHLAEAARGERDLNHHAKSELAARGLDSDAKWVGFDKAKKLHGSKPLDGDDEAHGHFQVMHEKILSAAAKGHLDLNHEAKKELASRGQDSNGKWVGFEAAKKHHGV